MKAVMLHEPRSMKIDELPDPETLCGRIRDEFAARSAKKKEMPDDVTAKEDRPQASDHRLQG